MTEIRNKIICLDNPNPRREYIISFKFIPVMILMKARQLTIRFIPDLLILDQDALKNYLDSLHIVKANTIEELTLNILDDITDQLIPRWIELTVRTKYHNRDITTISIEESQPNWKNTEKKY